MSTGLGLHSTYPLCIALHRPRILLSIPCRVSNKLIISTGLFHCIPTSRPLSKYLQTHPNYQEIIISNGLQSIYRIRPAQVSSICTRGQSILNRTLTLRPVDQSASFVAWFIANRRVDAILHVHRVWRSIMRIYWGVLKDSPEILPLPSHLSTTTENYNYIYTKIRVST